MRETARYSLTMDGGERAFVYIPERLTADEHAMLKEWVALVFRSYDRRHAAWIASRALASLPSVERS